MPRINLLPWREEQRKYRHKQFIFTLLGVAVLAIFSVICVSWFYAGQIEYQQQRNDRLRAEIRQLDRQITEIKGLEKNRDDLEARINVISHLQQDRARTVKFFETIASTVPEGVYLKEIEQKGRTTTISGVAESNARVSQYMRALDRSGWLANPQLIIIETKDNQGSLRISEFTLTVDMPLSADEKAKQDEQAS